MWCVRARCCCLARANLVAVSNCVRRCLDARCGGGGLAPLATTRQSSLSGVNPSFGSLEREVLVGCPARRCARDVSRACESLRHRVSSWSTTSRGCGESESEDDTKEATEKRRGDKEEKKFLVFVVFVFEERKRTLRLDTWGWLCVQGRGPHIPIATSSCSSSCT